MYFSGLEFKYVWYVAKCSILLENNKLPKPNPTLNLLKNAFTDEIVVF